MSVLPYYGAGAQTSAVWFVLAARHITSSGPTRRKAEGKNVALLLGSVAGSLVGEYLSLSPDPPDFSLKSESKRARLLFVDLVTCD